jgi:Tol biopolymer transport system component/DNA-binding winged helix-turn-helix (wHTH) protein
MSVGQEARSCSGVFRFGVFEADLKSAELRKSGLKIKLPGQPFEVLTMMLERAGEVVTREELQKRLWPDGVFVDFDHNLNNAINKIREALGDSAESPRFVETLSRRGYRFIAPIERLDLISPPLSADENRSFSLDPLEARPAEPSNQLSENEAVDEPAPPARPTGVNKLPWFVQRGKPVARLVLVLLLAFLFWRSLHRPVPLREPFLTRLTSDPGLTIDAVISPDGKLIAYASDRGGNNLDIYVRQVSGGDPLKLTSDPADDHQPAFSPDGGQIVFRSERAGGGIYIVSALGGNERPLASKGRNPRFSPAGDWIAFWVGPVLGHTLGAQAGKIFLIRSTGGNPKPIDPPGILAAGYPIWSPEGNHLLFYGSDVSNLAVVLTTSDWWVWPLTGGKAFKTGAFEAFATQNIRLVSLPPAPAEWMNDGVLFTARAGFSSVSIWQVSISPRNWRITGPPHRLNSGSGQDIRPSLAKTGLLVFSSLTENVDIWSIPIDGSQGLVNGPLEQLTSDLAADHSPSLSADGKKLAFVSWRSGNLDIWMKDLESGKEKPLTESADIEFSPRISPDGSLVGYASRGPMAQAGLGDDDIYVISAGEGMVRKLCDGCGTPRGWSPDNKLLFHEKHRGAHSTVDITNLATGKAGNYLQSSQLSVSQTTLTYDGHWITFNAFDRHASPPRLEVLVAPFQRDTLLKESDWIRIVSDQHYNDKPRWSPDGNRIYFVSDRDGFTCLWSQAVESESKRPVGPAQPVYHIHQVRRSILNVGGWGLMDISVAPDKIVLNLGEITGNIWMTKLEE